MFSISAARYVHSFVDPLDIKHKLHKLQTVLHQQAENPAQAAAAEWYGWVDPPARAVGPVASVNEAHAELDYAVYAQDEHWTWFSK